MHFRYAFFVMIFSVIISYPCQAQTQDDFTKKMSDVYMNASDPKKAMTSARELYKMVTDHKDLQTYANYYIVGQLFETQTPDSTLAKTCKAKADELLKAMTAAATTPQTSATGGDANSQWFNMYYPALFATSDPDNATKALKFLTQHTELQTFSNYTYIAYAFERNGDLEKAKENYEHALPLKGNEKSEFHSYAYYTNFLSHSGEYLKAEDYIRKMKLLSKEASDVLKPAYFAESLTSQVVYYLAIGDYASFLDAANEQYDYFSKTVYQASSLQCDPFLMSRQTLSAHAKETLKAYAEAEQLWRKRDSSHYAWIECTNKQLPNFRQYPLSMYPVFLAKSGNRSKLTKSLDFYIRETQTHYDNYRQYADFSIRFNEALQLAFLGGEQYHALFKSVLDHINATKDFRESTTPFAYYAYFNMRDHRYAQSKNVYDQLFKINEDWINDVIFSFGEKAFVTYYNNKLREGYDNYHSFVKLALEQKSPLFPQLASQAYNNLLLTKSLSLKGTQKRKQAFLRSNDPSIIKLYEEWLGKKQQLIRLYRKAEDAPQQQQTTSTSQEELTKLQNEVNHLENQLAVNARDFKKYLKISAPDWKTIRDKLKDGEAAIEMVRFQWRDQVYYTDTAYYAAYIITRSSQYPDVVYLADQAKDLDNRYYRFYQNNIRSKIEDTESYRHFWKPIKDRLNGMKKVYFSPDGIYHLISLPTLVNPETGTYLLDEIDIHYTTSSTDIQEETTTPMSNAVLMGRPYYKTLSPGRSPHAETRSFVSSFRSNDVADLPGTEEEVTGIKREMDHYAIRSDLYLHENATEDKMYQLHSPGILHIATHGYWSPAGNASTEGYRVFNAMVNSGLLLSGVVSYYSAGEYADTYDGILTAYEAQNLDLENTSLVVLSACETSLGHMDAGEGIYGLQRAFRTAGAKSIMTSLWKVDDEATREFMITFYREFLKTKDKAAAFRASQKALKEKYKDPYYWGAFILSGS